MSLAYSTALQDQIALLLTRGAYSSLNTQQKKAIDGGSTPPAVGGAVSRAYGILGQYANMHAVADDTASSIPASWEAWLVCEAAVQAAPAFPTAEITDLRRNKAGAMRDAIISYSRTSQDDTGDASIGAFTRASIRSDVIVNALRQQRGALYLEPDMVDTVIEDVVAEVWNEADWSFKEKQVTLTIATDGTVTASDSVAVDRIVGDRIYYDSAFGGDCIKVDYETMLNYKSASTSSGKPQYFYLVRSGDELSWIFERGIDKQYTAKALVTAQTPSMTGDTTMDAGLDLFPTDFRPIIKDRVLAVCLLRAGRGGVANPLLDMTTTKITGLLVRYDKTNDGIDQSEVHSSYLYGLGWNPGHIGGSGV